MDLPLVRLLGHLRKDRILYQIEKGQSRHAHGDIPQIGLGHLPAKVSPKILEGQFHLDREVIPQTGHGHRRIMVVHITLDEQCHLDLMVIPAIGHGLPIVEINTQTSSFACRSE